MARRLRRNWVVPRIRVRAPSRARPSPKKSEPLVEPNWKSAAFARAPALSTTRPSEIRLTPVLTHESSVRSFARCSLISVPPCSGGSVCSFCGCKISDLLLVGGDRASTPKITCWSAREISRLPIFGPSWRPRSRRSGWWSAFCVGLLLPVGLGQRVLDLPVLHPHDGLLPVLVEGPRVGQACLLHHAPGGGVDCHRLREHTLHAELGDALADQRARSFGCITLAPRGSLEPVAELDLVGAAAFGRVEREPP